MSELPRYLINWNMQQAYQYQTGDWVKFEDAEVIETDARELRECLKASTIREDSAQSELSALREEHSSLGDHNYRLNAQYERMCESHLSIEKRLADAERRNALPVDWADQLFTEMERRFELSKQYHQDHLVNDDTQIGVEFAIEWITAALTKPEEAKS